MKKSADTARHLVLLVDSDGARRAKMAGALLEQGIQTLVAELGPDAADVLGDPKLGHDVRVVCVAATSHEDWDIDEAIETVCMLRECVQDRYLPMTLVLPPHATNEHGVRSLQSGADDVLRWPRQEQEYLSRMQGMLRMSDNMRASAVKDRDLKTLVELTQSLNSSFDISQILYTVVQRIAEVASVGRVSIVLAPSESGREPTHGFVVAASDDKGVRNLKIALDRYPEIVEVLRTQHPLTIHDSSTHPLLEGVRDDMPVASRGAITLVPLRREQEVLGVLVLRAAASRGALSPREVDVCQIIANATATAIRNARVLERVRDEGQQARTLQETTAASLNDLRAQTSELKKSKDFLESLIDASVDAILAADMRGTILLFNRGAERIFGYSAEDVIGKHNVRDLYPDGMAKEAMKMLRGKELGGVGRLEPVRFAAKSKDATVVPISLSAAIIYSEEGSPIATVGIFTDLRDRLRVEEKLEQAQAKLALSEKQTLIAELAGAAAHELNQPLTSVIGYAELLIKKTLEPNIERMVSAIDGEARRMADIVKRIGHITEYETTSYVGTQRILDLGSPAK